MERRAGALRVRQHRGEARKPRGPRADRECAKARFSAARRARLAIETGIAIALVLGIPGSGGAESVDATVVFRGRPTREGVTTLAESNPRQCMTTVSPAKICSWRIEPGSTAHAGLAEVLRTTDTLVLLCEIDGPEPGRCTAHTASYARAGKTHPVTTVANSRRAESLARIARARTLAALAHSLGGIPDECVQRDDHEWVCVWRTEPGAPTHQTIAEAAGTTGRARLVCRLPLDGGEREQDSCRSQIAE